MAEGELEVEIEDPRNGIKFKVKGSLELVEQYFQKFGGLSSLQKLIAQSNNSQHLDSAIKDMEKPIDINSVPEKPKDVNSITEYVVKILSTEWGVSGRTSTELLEIGKIHGIMIPMSTLSGILKGLAKSGRLRRFKNPDDQYWKYYPPLAFTSRR